MNNEIKNGAVFGCCLLTFFMTAFGIIAIISYEKINNENDYLRKQIKEQSMLIEYLESKGE